MITEIINFFLHLDSYLDLIIAQFGILTYFILFLIIFFETGVVITPFLPGDSLLFLAGTIAARGSLNLFLLFIIFLAAAILGDSLNYSIGKFLGPKVFTEKSRFFKKEYITKTQNFYEKYGGKTIILARFVPIVRTFAPFTAGIGKMFYPKFLAYNIIGAIAWVSVFLFAGFFFGNIQFVQDNLTIFIFIIIFVSLLPAIIEYITRSRHT